MTGKISNRHSDADTVIAMNNELIMLRQENMNLRSSLIKLTEALRKVENVVDEALNGE